MSEDPSAAAGAPTPTVPPAPDATTPESKQPDAADLDSIDLDPADLDQAEREALSGVHLVVCGHGTRSALGQRTMAALVVSIRALSPVPVRAASVDVQEPSAEAVIAGLSPDRPGVVQPLLLSTGYHTRVDLQQAARRHPGLRRGHGMVVARALGPDPILAGLQVRRLREAGWRPEGQPGAVVMGAAGSSVAAGRQAASQQCDLLAEALGRPVQLGYGAGRPRIADVVETASGTGPVACSSYLLTPGTFQDRLAAAGPQLLAGPLLEAGDEAGLRAVALLALRRAAGAAAGGEDQIEAA